MRRSTTCNKLTKADADRLACPSGGHFYLPIKAADLLPRYCVDNTSMKEILPDNSVNLTVSATLIAHHIGGTIELWTSWLKAIRRSPKRGGIAAWPYKRVTYFSVEGVMALIERIKDQGRLETGDTYDLVKDTLLKIRAPEEIVVSSKTALSSRREPETGQKLVQLKVAELDCCLVFPEAVARSLAADLAEIADAEIKVLDAPAADVASTTSLSGPELVDSRSGSW